MYINYALKNLFLIKNFRYLTKNHKWKVMGSLNNLKDVHQLYMQTGETINKDSRDTFIKGQPKDLLDNFQVFIFSRISSG